MIVKAIKTSVFSYGMNLEDFIIKHVHQQLKEGSILAITSKLVSIAENQVIPKTSIDKKTLIQQESEHYLGSTHYGCHLGIRHGLLVPSAGIDESNSPHGDYILYPKAPFASLKKLNHSIRKRLRLKHLGTIMTDSRTLPLRRGVVGVALAYDGFQGTKSLIGQKDIFGRCLLVTKINIIDALAASAVLLMGEGAECQPLAIITDASVAFTDNTDPSEIQIPVNQDLYAPLFNKK